METLTNLRCIITIILLTEISTLSTDIVHGQNNANTSVPTSSVHFQFGVNPGYYGNGWGDKDIADIAVAAGAMSFRASLPGHFVEKWGYGTRVPEFNYYTQNLGMKGITVFIGEPSDNQVDKTIYSPATTSSKIFKKIYEPIWTGSGAGKKVNDQNIFAVYVYNLVKNYGSNVQYWEIVNEPDYTGFWDNANRSLSNNWFDTPPSPGDLPNLAAPIYYYIRLLRIAYEVIKEYSPESYVAPGGLGYPAFLDALLRYTDNPDNGKQNNTYPLKGGAYFDVLSFHSYPAFNLSEWDGGRVWHRHSDAAVQEITRLKTEFETVLNSRGYNGSQYPKKPFILTEVNIPRKSFGTHYGGDEAQRNFVIKAAVEVQKDNINQFYLFKTGESANFNNAGNAYDLMGLYENLTRDKKGSQKITQQGVALKTTNQLIYGWKYDSKKTGELNLPGDVGGGAFVKDGKYRYILWAKTSKDLSETVNAVYSFPQSMNLDKVSIYSWNYSVNNSSVAESSSKNIPLTGTPVFIEEKSEQQNPPKPPSSPELKIISFTGSVSGCAVDLSWEVSFTGQDNKISIGRGVDQNNFQTIYEETLTQSNSKKIISYILNPGDIVFYRLSIESKDGNPSVAKTEKIIAQCIDQPEHPGTSNSILAYPNPATDEIYISGDGEERLIRIFDVSGKILKTINTASQLEKVDISKLPSAIYYINISGISGNGSRTIKFLKK